MITPKQKLIRLAIKNISQIPLAPDRAAILEQAAELSEQESEKIKLRVAAKCIREADNAQLELIESYT